MPWRVLIDGRPMDVAVEVAPTRAARRQGLVGRDRFDGLLVLAPCRQVHTFGMRFPIDVAFCGADGRVLRTTTLARRRVSRPVWRSRFAVEAAAGTLCRVGAVPGRTVVVREHAGCES